MNTIIKTNKQLGKLGKNIFENIQDSIPCFKIFKDELNIECFVSGGFAVACLMAPRQQQTDTIRYNKIANGYYNDIDLYFGSLKDYNLARAYLLGNGNKIFENENCESFICTRPGSSHSEFQIIKFAFGKPSDIFKTFDLVNSCIAINSNYDIITHKDFYKTNFKKELDINNLDLNNKSAEDLKSYLSVIFNRIVKYSTRYGLDLSPKYKKLLQQLKEAVPVIEIKYDRRYGTGSGSKLVVETDNLWNRIETYLNDNYNVETERPF